MINQTRHSEELLARTKNNPPSFTIHLDHKHWSLNNGSKLAYHNQIASLLDDVRAHRIPADLLSIFASANVPFYDGNMIVELIDHRQTPMDVHRVVLYPDSESLYADICALTQDDLTAAQLESKILLATAPPLCLDPDPHLARIANHVLRVSTPTPPPSLKRKASTGSGLDGEQDESERARRAKIMSFMSPRPRGAPTYRVLEAAQALRTRLQTTAQPVVQSPNNEERKEEMGTIAPSMMFKSGKLPAPVQPQPPVQPPTPVVPPPPQAQAPAPSPSPVVARVPSVQPQAPVQAQPQPPVQPQQPTMTPQQQQQLLYTKQLQLQQAQMARMGVQANAITSLTNPSSSPRPPSTVPTHLAHANTTPQMAQMQLAAAAASQAQQAVQQQAAQQQQNPQPQTQVQQPQQVQVSQVQNNPQMQHAMQQQQQAYQQYQLMQQQRYWVYFQSMTPEQRMQWMSNMPAQQRNYVQALLRMGQGVKGVQGIQAQAGQQR